jgi:hypothetical protein
MSTIVANMTQIEAVVVEADQVIRVPIVAWVCDERFGEPIPIGAESLPEFHGFHDRATGRAWAGEQRGELHQTIAYLRGDSDAPR